MSDDDGQSNEEQRWCEGHQHHHPLSEFYQIKDPASAGGIRYRCKELTKKKNADALKAAPEGSRLRASQRRAKREWAQQHPEIARKNSANYRARKQKAAGLLDLAGRRGGPGRPAGAA